MKKNYIENLLKLREHNESIYIYPKIEVSENIYVTRKFTNDEIKLIKKNVSKNKRKFKINKMRQVETFYKNLIKTQNIYPDNTSKCIYNIKSSRDCILDSDLIILSSSIYLDQSQYPQLNDYDNIVSKFIEIFDFDCLKIMFSSQNEKNIIVLDVSNIKNNNAEILEEIYALLC